MVAFLQLCANPSPRSCREPERRLLCVSITIMIRSRSGSGSGSSSSSGSRGSRWPCLQSVWKVASCPIPDSAF